MRRTSADPNTVIGVIEGGGNIRAWCYTGACRHSGMVDLRALLDRLGPDHSVLFHSLAPRLRCSVCGGKDVRLTLGSKVPKIW